MRVINFSTLNLKLMKSLKCRDAGFDCDKQIEAPTEQEVLNKAAEHARSVHKVSVTPEMAQQIKKLIKDSEKK